MKGPLHLLVSEKPPAVVDIGSSMEEAIAEETSAQELRIKRATFGVPAALFLGMSIAKGVTIPPHLIEALTPSSSVPQNLETLVQGAKEAANTVTELGFAGLCGWVGLEFGDLALRSHRRLQEVDESHSH